MDDQPCRTTISGIFRTPLILYIEGDCDTREAYALLLRAAHIRVAEASNGIDGAACALKLMADVVVLDLALDDAYEALRRIRENPRTAHIPVIGLSGCTLRDGAPCCDGFLLKPQDVADVVQMVRDLLSEDRAQTRSASSR